MADFKTKQQPKSEYLGDIFGDDDGKDSAYFSGRYANQSQMENIGDQITRPAMIQEEMDAQ